MSNDADLIKLYSGRILALAADIPRTDRLENPSATVRRRSPLCGSTVTVDIVTEDGRITNYGQDVKACALGQAAASVVGANVVGCDSDDVTQARDALRAMLKDGGPAPGAPFEDLKVLEPARDFKNRHASILLALDAVCEAMDQAESQACI